MRDFQKVMVGLYTLYPDMCSSAFASEISRPPFPMTRPSSTAKAKACGETKASWKHTFMVSRYSSWNLDYTARREVTGRGLEEEKWLLWKCVFEFLDMVHVVTPYCNNLLGSIFWSESRE